MYDGLVLDKLKEECGIFGIFGPGMDVARISYFGLYALQHRGQESAGIAVSNGKHIKLHKAMGLVADAFNDNILNSLEGHMALGHVRYSTTGSSLVINAQPLVCHYSRGMIALAHNGNLTNTGEIRRSLAANGAVFQSTIDSEVIVNLIARHSQHPIEEAILRCMQEIKGAYSFAVMTENKLIGVRDPFGVRPLCLGKMGDAYIIASESCALDTVGAKFIRDVEPGEIVTIDEKGISSIRSTEEKQKASCIFEYIYFARPDSYMDGFVVSSVRREMGRQLAREYPVEADMVIPIPDSGTAAARGFAEESGIPFEEGLMKNRYIGRTFIQPDQAMRDVGVKIKLNPIRNLLNGKRVVMIDDSIVRGTTSRRLVQMVREAGAKEVHMLVSSPPYVHSCYYGVDTSSRSELIAANMPVEKVREFIGADGLHYLSREGLLSVFKGHEKDFCLACFDGKYPIEVQQDMTKLMLE